MKPSRFSAVTAAVLLLGTSPPRAQPAAEIRWQNQRLSVHVVNGPLRAILEQVVSMTGLEADGLERLTGTVAADFDDLVLPEAVRTLLAGHGYALIAKAAAEGQPARYVLRVGSPPNRAVDAARAAPIVVPALEAARLADVSPDVDDDEEDEDTGDLVADLAQQEATGIFGPASSFDALSDLLDDDNPLIRSRALTEMNRRDPGRTLPALVSAMGDGDAAVAEVAIALLGDRMDRDSMTRLGDALIANDDPAIRIGALRVLAHRAAPASVPYLRRVERDPHPLIREAASQILGEFERRRRAASQLDDGR